MPAANRSRRQFLQQSTGAVLGGSLALSAADRSVHASQDNTIRVGLIGCGGRGRGAAVNAGHAGEEIKLVAMADLFPEPLEYSKKLLKENMKSQFAVPDEQCFHGFDAYQKLLATDVDVVILTTPPHFRPAQLEAAIAANKHVFCEKPVAVDPAGVRAVLETCKKAEQKSLNVVSGLCWRYDLGVRETMNRIKDGAIGELVTIQENYLTGTLWHRGRKPEWSEMEYQLRNWMYFTWLSGDHIVEQHVHSLDKAMWLMDDNPPARCFGLGGRQARVDPQWGHIYDHFAVCYEWESGVRTYAYTRQMKGQGIHNNVEDYVFGTKGNALVLKHRIEGESKWRYRGEKPSMYDVEHQELFDAIRQGRVINNGKYMSYSTLLAIMGREACYTGQSITWDEAMNAQQKLGPDDYKWGDAETPQVAVPGVTTFA